MAAEPDADDRDDDGDADELVPARDAHGGLVYEADFGGLSNLNRGRLPLFARLDLRATWRPGWARGRGELFIDVINAPNRRNVFAVDTRLDFNPTGSTPTLTEHHDTSLPLLPTIGFRFRF